jgi:hypothetical protein
MQPFRNCLMGQIAIAWWRREFAEKLAKKRAQSDVAH